MTRDSPVDVFVMEATGALLAALLAGAGKSVVVLEAGPAWTLCDLMSSQTWSRLLKWYGAPVLPCGRHPFGHNMATGSGLGGAAIYHYASLLRLHMGDSTLLSDSGVGLDWPIGDDDQASNYDRIQAEMGVAGGNVLDTAAALVWPRGNSEGRVRESWAAGGAVTDGGDAGGGCHRGVDITAAGVRACLGRHGDMARPDNIGDE